MIGEKAMVINCAVAVPPATIATSFAKRLFLKLKKCSKSFLINPPFLVLAIVSFALRIIVEKK